MVHREQGQGGQDDQGNNGQGDHDRLGPLCSLAEVDIFQLQLGRRGILGRKGLDHVPRVPQIAPAQQQAGILLAVPLQGADLQPAVLLQPVQVELDGGPDLGQSLFQVVCFENISPVESADLFLGILRGNIPEDDGNDALVVQYGAVHLHLADLRCDGVGADHKDERVGLLDPAEDLLEPVDGRRDGFPVHPDLLSHGFELFNQLSGGDGIFSGIGNKQFCHTTPLQILYPSRSHVPWRAVPENCVSLLYRKRNL